MNYINAHATSTLVGDIAEIKAVKSAFPDTKHLKVNGTKSMIGHCLGAAGGMEAIATLKAIETGWVHPTLNQVGHLLLAGLLHCNRASMRPIFIKLPWWQQHNSKSLLLRGNARQ